MCLHILLNQLHLSYREYNVVATNKHAKTFQKPDDLYELEERNDRNN
jgi:hypothetical protein